jgi:hypothetical protein
MSLVLEFTTAVLMRTHHGHVAEVEGMVVGAVLWQVWKCAGITIRIGDVLEFSFE